MLRELILEEVRKNGYLTFDRFVELSLYHPEFGYYTVKRVGRKLAEDFVTSPELTPAFGKLLSSFLKKKSLELNLPLRVLELGGGKGFLASDISREPFIEDYTVLEVREKPDWIGGVNWVRNLTELKGFEGFVIANEFFDAFPFKRIVKRDGELCEVVLVEEEGKLRESLVEFNGEVPCSLKEGEEYPLFLWEGFIREFSDVVGRVYLVVFDYGGKCGELSFRAFRENRLVDDYLIRVGETDLTASVDFKYLTALLESSGFKVVSFKPQSSFLLENGIERFLTPAEVPAALTLLVDMGRRFRVLEAAK
ncbi:MAG: hypothetical protein DSZ25_00160 [Thermovibrio sp.]|nr:MAG: hypothetical protein DSZ25_00160 [Thermovibrio sp.]